MNKITNFTLIVTFICTVLCCILLLFGNNIHFFSDFLNKRSVHYSGGIGGTSAFYSWKEYLVYLSGEFGAVFFVLTLLNMFLEALNKEEVNLKKRFI